MTQFLPANEDDGDYKRTWRVVDEGHEEVAAKETSRRTAALGRVEISGLLMTPLHLVVRVFCRHPTFVMILPPNRQGLLDCLFSTVMFLIVLFRDL